jgi:hypothetical protein
LTTVDAVAARGGDSFRPLLASRSAAPPRTPNEPFRIDERIVVFERPIAVIAPIAALFRGQWALGSGRRTNIGAHPEATLDLRRGGGL